MIEALALGFFEQALPGPPEVINGSGLDFHNHKLERDPQFIWLNRTKADASTASESVDEMFLGACKHEIHFQEGEDFFEGMNINRILTGRIKAVLFYKFMPVRSSSTHFSLPGVILLGFLIGVLWILAVGNPPRDGKGFGLISGVTPPPHSEVLWDLVIDEDLEGLAELARAGWRGELFQIHFEGKDDTPLHLAVRRGLQSSAAWLLSAGVLPDVVDAAGDTPLHVAASTGRVDIVRLLLQHGANPQRLNSSGKTAWDLAWEAGMEAMLDLLKPSLLDLQALLTEAIQAGEAEKVDWLLRQGVDLNQQDFSGQSPVIWAVLERQIGLLYVFLKHGADPDAPLKRPLHPRWIQQLTRQQSKLTYYLQRESGLTPLMIASAIGDADAVRLLLQGGASKSRVTAKHRRTAINFAADSGRIDILQALVRTENNPYFVRVSISSQQAQIYRDGKLIESSAVSTGRPGHRTPKGDYVVTSKHRHWISTIYHTPMPFFLRLNQSAIGLHQGHLPGYPASAGCVRLPAGKARKFFEMLPLGTWVQITD